MKLSILDQSPILTGMSPRDAFDQTTELIQAIDGFGFHRFWVSEHHSTQSLAGSAPEILVAHLASNSKRIRVGTGGILIPHYSSYKVAEVFRVLETLHPKRIDLGIGRAPGGAPSVNLALNGGKFPDVQNYPTQVGDLMAYLHGEDPQNLDIQATPIGESAPPIWMLGSSGTSARLAASLGTSYSFAHFINGHGGTGAMRRYFEHFTPSIQQETPQGNVSVFAVCGETEGDAELLASSLDLAILKIEQGGNRSRFPTKEEASSYPYSLFEKERVKENRKRMIVGNPEQVKQELENLAESYGVDEIILNTIVHPFEERIKSYERIAKIFKLNEKEG
ncbi:LLM class flavin-dependent oxidoreductase [Aquibacillus sp. 3ASR75-11]|uniref:LLM class flavin-dependent oxidoreductase n=1 Tax=Terrihalobacillus insolitus TaxID=2950438 RepID=A0A9X3WSU9_9BACI|nr:LLM class flavin-dependent oxidoreductase [Terrihalobacillus insolitus]MDC3425192.1 LLM class flavin-dependent oxidoreductase [Terrihalobacillus insolitus]